MIMAWVIAEEWRRQDTCMVATGGGLGVFGKKVHGKNGHGKKRPRLEKRSTKVGKYRSTTSGLRLNKHYGR